MEGVDDFLVPTVGQSIPKYFRAPANGVIFLRERER